MKDIGNYKLSKVREALGRLDGAVGRLEAATQGLSGGGEASQKLQAELETLTQDHAALKRTAGDVAERLDAAIERLGAAVNKA